MYDSDDIQSKAPPPSVIRELLRVESTPKGKAVPLSADAIRELTAQAAAAKGRADASEIRRGTVYRCANCMSPMCRGECLARQRGCDKLHAYLATERRRHLRTERRDQRRAQEERLTIGGLVAIGVAVIVVGSLLAYWRAI